MQKSYYIHHGKKVEMQCSYFKMPKTNALVSRKKCTLEYPSTTETTARPKKMAEKFRNHWVKFCAKVWIHWNEHADIFHERYFREEEKPWICGHAIAFSVGDAWVVWYKTFKRGGQGNLGTRSWIRSNFGVLICCKIHSRFENVFG